MMGMRPVVKAAEKSAGQEWSLTSGRTGGTYHSLMCGEGHPGLSLCVPGGESLAWTPLSMCMETNIEKAIGSRDHSHSPAIQAVRKDLGQSKGTEDSSLPAETQHDL